MNKKLIYNIKLKRYSEIYTYDCECGKNSMEDERGKKRIN